MTKWKYYDEANSTINTLLDYKSIVIYDVETTGLNKKIDKIIQFSGIRYTLPDWTEEGRIDIYIKPPFKINGSEASEKNGITDEILEEKGIPELEAYHLITNFIKEDDLIAGYNNQRFDDKMMETLYKAHKNEFKYKENIDIYKFVKMIVPAEAVTIMEKVIKDNKEVEKKKVSYTLENVTHYYDPENEIQFHSSINDVEATSFVFVMAMTEAQMMINEYIEQENARKAVPRQDAKVLYVNLYNPSKNIKRVYVKTDQGTLFYDEIKHEWRAKTGSVDSLNMDGIVSQVFDMLDITKESELFNAAVRAERKKQKEA